MWHSRPRLCFLFFPKFGVAGFPAVGDLGQELADVFDFGERPEMCSKFPELNGFRRWNFPGCHVTDQSSMA